MSGVCSTNIPVYLLLFLFYSLSFTLCPVSSPVAAHMSVMCPDGDLAEPLLELILGEGEMNIYIEREKDREKGRGGGRGMGSLLL